MTSLASVTCPACFEEFDVAVPPADETPCTVDYDCEICCRPMIIRFEIQEGDVIAEALGLGD